MSGLKQSRKSLDNELSVNFIRKEVMLSVGRETGWSMALGSGKCHSSWDYKNFVGRWSKEFT